MGVDRHDPQLRVLELVFFFLLHLPVSILSLMLPPPVSILGIFGFYLLLSVFLIRFLPLSNISLHLIGCSLTSILCLLLHFVLMDDESL